jgi:hypothetical protein
MIIIIRYKREREREVYVCVYVIETKGLSKSILTAPCFIQCALEFVRGVLANS